MTDTKTNIPTNQNLGASEVAAVLGLSPWESAWDVWARKTGRMPPREESPQMRAGTLMEPVVLKLAERELGEIEVHPTELTIPGTPIVCHRDATLKATGYPVEAKTAGLYGPLVGDWGEDGTDDIPDYYWVQLGTYMRASKQDLGYLAALLGGRGFHVYACPAKDPLMDTILERVSKWWDQHVVADSPPIDSLPSEETVRRIVRTEATVELADERAVDLLNAYQQHAAAKVVAEERADQAWLELMAMLGDHAAAKLPDGSTIGFTTYTQEMFGRQQLLADHPELREKYVMQATRRRRFVRRPKA